MEKISLTCFSDVLCIWALPMSWSSYWKNPISTSNRFERCFVLAKPMPCWRVTCVKKKSLQLSGSPTFVLNEARQKLYGNVGYGVIEANIKEVLKSQNAGTAS